MDVDLQINLESVTIFQEEGSMTACPAAVLYAESCFGNYRQGMASSETILVLNNFNNNKSKEVDLITLIFNYL